MSFADTALQMVGIAIPILIGYLARRLGYLDPEVDGRLSRLVVDVALPCLIVASACVSELPTTEVILQVLVFSTLGYLISIALGLVVPRLMRAPADELGSLSYAIAFGNVGFIGFPVTAALLGEDAVLLAAVANIPFNILVSGVGMLMISGIPEGGGREVVRACGKSVLSPMLVTSAVALGMTLLGINDLGVLGDGLATCGNLTTPAALLITGSELGGFSVREMLSNARAYVSVAMRLVGAPLLALLAVGAFGVSPVALAVIVIGQAMPVAANGTLFCLMNDVDPKTMSQATFISIVACIATIPLVATLIAA